MPWLFRIRRSEPFTVFESLQLAGGGNGFPDSLFFGAKNISQGKKHGENFEAGWKGKTGFVFKTEMFRYLFGEK